MTDTTKASPMACFEASRALFEGILGLLTGEEASVLSHSELETMLDAKGNELKRQLLQNSLDLRALCERRVEDVVGVGHGGVDRGSP